MLSPEYIAGIIDGEGSIGTTKTGKYGNVVGRIMVANTDLRLLYALKETVGGTITIRKVAAKEGWKPYASIAWTNRIAERVLEMVLPHLVLKSEQAVLCLQLIKMRDAPKNQRYDYVRSPIQMFPNRTTTRLKSDIVNIEEAIVDSLHKLNKKGV